MAAAPAEALGPGRPPPASPRWAAPPLRPGEWGTSLTPGPFLYRKFLSNFLLGPSPRPRGRGVGRWRAGAAALRAARGWAGCGYGWRGNKFVRGGRSPHRRAPSADPSRPAAAVPGRCGAVARSPVVAFTARAGARLPGSGTARQSRRM